ncbi:hypothetical protein [uncultured Erythrobacter sp.]|uniref:hypothetical protein n=1 Tax=uncultured Erythrobacter sp. TaxID=263913 RepID=UPI00262A362F|nr:hypothetical protein [uncultured Erythrobacter sp.]
MRSSFLILTALPFLMVPASADDTNLKMPLNNPAYVSPAKPWTTIENATKPVVYETQRGVRLGTIDPQDCRDRISKAREALGLPPQLDREPASPDKPHLIYAVDRRQDGCSVMVMKGNRDDIRQLPLPPRGPFLRIPAETIDE